MFLKVGTAGILEWTIFLYVGLSHAGKLQCLQLCSLNAKEWDGGGGGHCDNQTKNHSHISRCPLWKPLGLFQSSGRYFFIFFFKKRTWVKNEYLNENELKNEKDSHKETVLSPTVVLRFFPHSLPFVCTIRAHQ